MAAGEHIAVDMVAVAGAAAHREEVAAGDGVYRPQVPEQAGEELQERRSLEVGSEQDVIWHEP